MAAGAAEEDIIVCCGLGNDTFRRCIAAFFPEGVLRLLIGFNDLTAPVSGTPEELFKSCRELGIVAPYYSYDPKTMLSDQDVLAYCALLAVPQAFSKEDNPAPAIWKTLVPLLRDGLIDPVDIAITNEGGFDMDKRDRAQESLAAHRLLERGWPAREACQAIEIIVSLHQLANKHAHDIVAIAEDWRDWIIENAERKSDIWQQILGETDMLDMLEPYENRLTYAEPALQFIAALDGEEGCDVARAEQDLLQALCAGQHERMAWAMEHGEPGPVPSFESAYSSGVVASMRITERR